MSVDPPQEIVRFTLELPRGFVDRIDGLRAQLRFLPRGVIVVQLIRELLT